MDIYEFSRRFYESIKTEKAVIGKSLFGRDVYAIKLGAGSPVGIVQYAMHGREYITAKLAEAHYRRGGVVGSVWLLPLVNPDGALMSELGISSVPQAKRAELIALNGGEDFSLWKANGRGVDLNVNFPARWGTGAKNTRRAGAENYIGAHPISEPETIALAAFTGKIRPQYTVSYHTKGEEIYWYFYQNAAQRERDRVLGEVLARSTGYPLAYAGNSAGGYKDWCISRFSIPSFTVEVGADRYAHPLGEGALQDIITKNENSLADLSRAYGKMV